MASDPASSCGSAASQSEVTETVTPRKHSRAQLNGAVDTLLEDSVVKTRAYIMRELSSRDSAIADFISDMLRDGEVEKALARKKARKTALMLGAKLPEMKKTALKWKHLGRRFDRELVAELRGTPWSKEDEDKLKKLTGTRYSQLLTIALNQSGETPVPKEHVGSAYEGPLKAVCKQRHADMGNRIKDITVDALLQLSYYELQVDMTGVHIIWVNFLRVALPFPFEESVRAANGPWALENAWSINGCRLVSSRGDVKFVHNWLAERSPTERFPDEVQAFEIVSAAQPFDQLVVAQASVLDSPALQSGAASASPAEEAAAGDPPAVDGASPPADE
jgi:hypothetical protein